MVNIKRGEVVNGKHSLAVLFPDRSETCRPRSQALLVLGNGRETDMLLIQGDAQFADLVMCMGVFSRTMIHWPDGQPSKAEHFELGHARLAVQTVTLLYTSACTLTLQILAKPVISDEDLKNVDENVAMERTWTLTAAEIRSWGKVFAKFDRIELEQAFVTDSEEWCFPARFAHIVNLQKGSQGLL